ncbi:MAG: hypothetical protein U0V73_07730 [Acidimicrobiia bacterium]
MVVALRRDVRAVALCASVPLTIFLVERVLKPVIERTTGVHGDHLYPSGQAAATAAAATTVFVLVALRSPRRSIRAALVVVAVIIDAAIDAALIGSYSHLPFDTLGGLAFGTACALSCCLIVDAIADRFTRLTSSGTNNV